MLDIKLFRDTPEIIKDSLKKRFQEDKIKIVDDIIKLDKEFRDIKGKTDLLKHDRNEISKKIAELKKAGKDATKVLAQAKKIPQEIAENDSKIKEIEEKIREKLMQIPNILHPKTPVGKDEKDSKVIKTWGKIVKHDFELKSHGEIAEGIKGADFTRSAKVAGTGFYYMTGDLALLNQALIRLAVDHLVKKGFTYVEPPLILKKKPYSGVVDLGDFENVMYKIEGEDAYLIATAEHPLVAMFMDEVIYEQQLPIKLVGYSMCFRKEIGSHGVDTRGLFRTHQFNKVEQVIFCRPDESWKIFEELQRNSEELFEALEIPYHVLDISSGDLGPIAARKHDI
jgi:seryl-tRNA synthetase